MVKSELWKELIFPRRCVVCDEIVNSFGEMVCPKCIPRIVYVKEPCCMKCGKELKKQEKEYCEDCEKKAHRYIQGMALFDYGSMADSIFRFKNKNRVEYAEFYGRELAEKKGAWLRAVAPDALIPVPIHASRKRDRGYNQAELIAKELSICTGIPVDTSVVCRCRRTKPMKNLTNRERQNNLKRAFKIMQNDVKLNTIVIVDDVYTSGSTIDAVATVLQEAGVSKVYFLALTIGRGI